jgi:nicotinamide mononucleotide transporter
MDIYHQFIYGLQQTKWYEFIAVVFGITSVWLNKKENILVYPVGLVNTTLYIFISIQSHLIGEASVNLYYTIVSIYGWILWAKKDKDHQPVLHITWSTRKQWISHLVFFLSFYIVIFLCLSYLKKEFAPGALPAADAFASATAFTGMWLMAKKKIESWYWWIATNIASIPLYFVKELVFTSFYYLVLLILAVFGLIEWINKAKKT